MNHTKIVATIGPSSREPQMLRSLIEAGVDVARLNMSHADHNIHAENIRRIRAAAQEVNRPVAILADLQGPKLRVGKIQGGNINIVDGERIVLTTRDLVGHRNEGGESELGDYPSEI
jgi:pyruvate kinase